MTGDARPFLLQLATSATIPSISRHPWSTEYIPWHHPLDQEHQPEQRPAVVTDHLYGGATSHIVRLAARLFDVPLAVPVIDDGVSNANPASRNYLDDWFGTSSVSLSQR